MQIPFFFALFSSLDTCTFSKNSFIFFFWKTENHKSEKQE